MQDLMHFQTCIVLAITIFSFLHHFYILAEDLKAGPQIQAMKVIISKAHEEMGSESFCDSLRFYSE